MKNKGFSKSVVSKGVFTKRCWEAVFVRMFLSSSNRKPLYKLFLK